MPMKISTPHPVAFTTVSSTNDHVRVDASGLTFTVRVIKADGSSVAGGATGGIGGKGITQPDVTNALGCCYYTPVASDINVLGEAIVRISAPGMETREIPVDVVSWDPYNAVPELQSGLATASALTTAQTDLTTLTGRLTSGRASNLDNIDAAVSTRAPSSTAVSNVDYSSARATKIDNLDAAITTRASASALATVQADTDDIQTRLPVALVGGKMSSDVGSWLGTAAATPTVAGIPKVEEPTLVSRLTSTRAGLLDNLDAAISTRAPSSTALSTTQWTNGRATNLDNIDAAVSTRAPAATAVSNVDYTSVRATKLDALDAAITSRAPASTALSTAQWTNLRAAALDNLDAANSTLATASSVSGISSGISDIGSAVAVVQADTDNIQGRLPTALDGDGNIMAGAQSISSEALSSIADAIFDFVLESAPVNATTFAQRLRVIWSILASKANGLVIPTATVEHMRDSADTKDRATFTLATNGSRTPGSFDGT